MDAVTSKLRIPRPAAALLALPVASQVSPERGDPPVNPPVNPPRSQAVVVPAALGPTRVPSAARDSAAHAGSGWVATNAEDSRISPEPDGSRVRQERGPGGEHPHSGECGYVGESGAGRAGRIGIRALGVVLTAVAGAVLAALSTSLAEGEPAPGTGAKAARHTNRLSRETSPYLLSHAHNPVDWYPWGPEALEKAKKEDKPIFLSIGYSACHWCHVMEKKVFSDPEIARYMNEHFVNIKVDREERPDLDDVYMTALQVYFQAMRSPQTGGWPLSIFLTPDGRPLGGGTYFPPEDGNGLPGFPTLLKRVVEMWRDNRKQLEDNADILADGTRASLKTRASPDPVKLDHTIVASVIKSLADSYDEQYGGFGFNAKAPDRPKFPVPTKLALLQYEAKRRNNEQAGKMLYHTLDKMAAGGIYDHIGGGFHRYSTDRFWRVPHFEKMLYDNAQLADVYAEAYRHTNQGYYKTVVEETIEFVFRELRDAGGAFYAALDADSEGAEGKFYVWTDRDLAKVLTADERSICNAVYGTGGEQNFEFGHVLELKQSLDDVAKQLNMPALQLEQKRLEICKKLLAARQKRPRPARDDKILVSWNGLMIRALAKAGVILQKPEYVQAAEKAADFILKELRDDKGRLLHSYAGGQAKLIAYLDDYAYLNEGLLALHLATGDAKWANAAQKLCDAQLQMFWDEEGKACYFTSNQHEELLARTKNPYDSVLPSGNSVSVRNLLRLASFSKQPEYRERARETLELFTPLIQGSPSGLTNMALALSEYLDTTETASKSPRSLSPATGISPESAVVLAKGTKDEKPKSTKKGQAKPAVVTGQVFLSVDRLPAGKTCKVLVQLQIAEGWHIHANPAGDPDSDIATEVELEESKLGIELKSLKYPKGKSVERGPGEKPQILLTGKVNVIGQLEIPANAAGREEELVVTVMHQACDDKQCLAPKPLKLRVPVKVARPDEPVKAINESLFAPPAKKK